MSPFTEYWGIWNDQQVPNTYSHYADISYGNITRKSKTCYGKTYWS